MKKRDAESTRSKITACAQQLFTEKGYDGAGIREIAACAGVDAALIARYFGSKRQLFEEAVIPHFNINAMMDVPAKAFAEAVSKEYAFKAREAKPQFDPMIALLKSASSGEVCDLIRDAIDKQVITPLSGKVEGQNALPRAALIVSFLGGFDLLRRIIAVSSMSTTHNQMLAEELRRAIEALLQPG